MNINDIKLNIAVWLCLRINMIKMTHSIQNFAIISYVCEKHFTEVFFFKQAKRLLLDSNVSHFVLYKEE